MKSKIIVNRKTPGLRHFFNSVCEINLRDGLPVYMDQLLLSGRLAARLLCKRGTVTITNGEVRVWK